MHASTTRVSIGEDYIDEGTIWKCTQCQNTHVEYGKGKYRYCPHCGKEICGSVSSLTEKQRRKSLRKKADCQHSEDCRHWYSLIYKDGKYWGSYSVGSGQIGGLTVGGVRRSYNDWRTRVIKATLKESRKGTQWQFTLHLEPMGIFSDTRPLLTYSKTV